MGRKPTGLVWPLPTPIAQQEFPQYCRDRWLSSWEPRLLFQRTQVWFPAPTGWLATACNIHFRGCNALFWPPRVPNTHPHNNTNKTFKKNTSTHNVGSLSPWPGSLTTWPAATGKIRAEFPVLYYSILQLSENRNLVKQYQFSFTWGCSSWTFCDYTRTYTYPTLNMTATASGWHTTWLAGLWPTCTCWQACGWHACGWHARGWQACGWHARGFMHMTDTFGWHAHGWHACGWQACGWKALQP